MNAKRIGTAVCTGAALLFLSGCGGLSAADKTVCNDAAQYDALGVVQDAAASSRSDIISQALRITETSAPSTDEAAMRTIVQICKDNGYSPSGLLASGLSGQ